MNTAPKVFTEGTFYYYEDAACPYCIDWKHESSVCFTVAGFLREVLRHIAEIENTTIEEIHCRAKLLGIGNHGSRQKFEPFESPIGRRPAVADELDARNDRRTRRRG